jgi:hypothetical protein
MLFHDPLFASAALVDHLADAVLGLSVENTELARQLTRAATSLMHSLVALRFATGKRRDPFRRRARAHAEQALALLHVMDEHAYLQPTPGHRDALLAHAATSSASSTMPGTACRPPEPKRRSPPGSRGTISPSASLETPSSRSRRLPQAS